MALDSAGHESLDLAVVGDIGLHDALVAQAEFFCQRMQPIQPPCTQHNLGAGTHEMACCFRTQATAAAGDDDHLVFDSLGHVFLA
ncbi:hypothetical protein D3C86_2065680 [compost metagenome]